MQEQHDSDGVEMILAGSAELQRLQDSFSDRHRYLLKLLTAKTLKISTQADLKFFTMSLNFNKVYKEAD